MSTDKRKGKTCMRCDRVLDNPTGYPTYCNFCLEKYKADKNNKKKYCKVEKGML